MAHATHYYNDYLFAEGFLAYVRTRRLRICIHKKVNEYDADVRQEYYRQLDNAVFDRSFQIEGAAWAVGEAYADLEDLYYFIYFN